MDDIEKRARELLAASHRKRVPRSQKSKALDAGFIHPDDHAAMDAIVAALSAAPQVPEGYVLVQEAPLMDMLEAAWDAMDDEDNADFIDPEDLAIAWYAMLNWCRENPGRQQ